MSRHLEEKWRAMPCERELQVRMEILVEEQRGLCEAQERREAVEPYDTEWRIADRAVQHFLERVGKTQRRITKLRSEIAAEPPSRPELTDDARARKLSDLKLNSEVMLGRFLVVTPGYNAPFLVKLGHGLADIDVDAVLRAENIRLVSLDNPERWTPEGRDVEPQKFLALHPTDVIPAIQALKASLGKADRKIDEDERAERATVVWLPRNDKGFHHPDPARTVYPPGIGRLAMDCRRKSSHPGWAVLRGWGTELDRGVQGPINGLEVDFVLVPGKGRYHALLDPGDVEEILL